jgi:hypothetical protein
MIDKKGRFQKGNKPWNTNLKGIHLSPDTEFKTGAFVGDKHPSWLGGVHIMTNDCVHLWDGANKRVRRPRKVYEEHHGAIPAGYIVIHLDGNHHNDSPDNLKAISRAENLKRNNNK